MIFFDDYGYPVNSEGDGGDSLVRAAILKSDSANKWQFNLVDYIPKTGLLTRHPKTRPWNFPGNLSRDQMMVGLMGLRKCGLHADARAIFWATAKRFFFCQNFFRDAPPSLTFPKGSRKYPWPHEFHEDSDIRKPLVKKSFDFADPLLPNHLGVILISGRMWYFYFLLPVCYLFHIISLMGHATSHHHEENQAIAECDAYRTLKIYRILKPRWVEISEKYWTKRGELEYHLLLRNMVESA